MNLTKEKSQEYLNFFIVEMTMKNLELIVKC